MFHGHPSKSTLTFDNLGVEEGFQDHPDRLSLFFHVHPFSEVRSECEVVRTMTIEIMLQSITTEYWDTARFQSGLEFVHYTVRHRLRTRSDLQNRHQFRFCIYDGPYPDLMP